MNNCNWLTRFHSKHMIHYNKVNCKIFLIFCWKFFQFTFSLQNTLVIWPWSGPIYTAASTLLSSFSYQQLIERRTCCKEDFMKSNWKCPINWEGLVMNMSQFGYILWRKSASSYTYLFCFWKTKIAHKLTMLDYNLTYHIIVLTKQNITRRE